MTPPHTRIIQSFSASAATYDQEAWIQHEVSDLLFNFITSHLQEEPEVVLDLGCGTGWLAKRSLHHFQKSTHIAADISLQMLRAIDPPLGLHRVAMNADLPAIAPLPMLIMSNMTLQWLPDLRQALDRYRKICKNIGFSIPLAPSFHEWHHWCEKNGAQSMTNPLHDARSISTVCQSLSPARFHMQTHDMFVPFEKPIDFPLSLKKIGADVCLHPQRPKPYQLLNARKKDPTFKGVTYHIGYFYMDF
jgi:SAM-dependent methyltransferase